MQEKRTPITGRERESVQQGNVKALEERRFEVVRWGPTAKNGMVPHELPSTPGIVLFILRRRAFPELEGVIKERLNKKSSMGFQADLTR